MVRRRLVALVVCSLVAAPLLTATTASADDAVTLPPTFSADPLPTWQTDGAVWALETIGNTVYVGGDFSSVRPPGAAPGTGQVARNNFAAFNAQTGDLLACNPSFTHTVSPARVFALSASPDGSRLYVGGAFNRVGAAQVSNLAAIDPSSCSVLPTTTFRRPAVLATVRALDSTATNVYAGGDFNTVDGQARTKYAAFDAAGTLLASSLTLQGGTGVKAILATPDVGKVYVGGDFTGENGNSNRGLVAVDPQSSAIVSTFPGWVPANSAVKALTRDATGFYVGDEGTGFGQFDGRMAGELATDTMRWRDNCLGATQALAVDGGVLYGGHHTHECSLTAGGWEEDGIRNHLTAQDVRDRTLIPTFFPDTNDGEGAAPQGPRAMVVAGDQLWVGGEFTTVNTVSQRALTRFGRTDTGTVFAPALTVTSDRADQNVVNWVAGFDRDEDSLIYDVFRDGVLVHTDTAQSREWTRRTMSWTDTGVVGGQTYAYRIRVREPDGGIVSPQGATTTVTTTSNNRGYAGAVLQDDPSIYWHLDETTEQNAATRTGDPYLRARVWDSSGHGEEGTAERGYDAMTGGYALGGPNALQDGSQGSSVTLDGKKGRIAESFANDFVKARPAPTAYSVELWFRTSGTAGGRLVGWGNRRTELYQRTQPANPNDVAGVPVYVDSQSSQSDRVLYLSDAGKLEFGTQAATKVVIKGSRSYNDGQWHHAVATAGPAGMNLFVDGIAVATNPSTQSSTFGGFWKVGYDSLTGWSDKPANTALKGGVDEVAVYPTQLSRAQAVAHYLAGRPDAVIDLSPPTTPANVHVTRSGQNAQVTWSAASDNVGVVGYEVHRTAAPDDALSAATQVGSTTSALSFTEIGVPQGRWYYRVVAVDAAGNPSEPSLADSVDMPAPPVQLTVTSSADTYVHSSLKTTNFGSATVMTADASPQQIALLRFALPSAPAGTQLVSATLRLRTTTNSFAGSVDPQPVQRAANGWSESSVTWNSRPALINGTLGTMAAGTVPATLYDTPLNAAALAALVGSDVTLAMPGGGGGDGSEFQTREASSNRPQLVLGFGPTDGPPDTTAPTQPQAVQATLSGANVTVTWAASSDDVAVAGYQVHRSASAAGALSASTLVGSTSAALTLTETSVPSGTWYYRVLALDGAGNLSQPSSADSVVVPDLPPPPPPTSTVTVTSGADTYVHSSLKTSNFGSMTVMTTDASPQQIALLRFALPSAPAGTHLVSATLRLRTTTNTFAGSVDPQPVQRAGDGWDEHAVTWTTRPALIGPVLGMMTAGTVPGTLYDVSLDVSAVDALLGSSQTLSLPGGGSGDGAQFQTREAASNRPQLILGFAP